MQNQNNRKVLPIILSGPQSDSEDVYLDMQTHTHILRSSGVMLEMNQLEQQQGQESIQLSPARVRGHRVNQTTARRDCEKQRCVSVCV